LGSFYEERNKAIKRIDLLINKVVIDGKKILDVEKIEFEEAYKYNCPFMKIFYSRVKGFQKERSNLMLVDKKLFLQQK
jgi:predicted PP-loop superfamily ATPase